MTGVVIHLHDVAAGRHARHVVAAQAPFGVVAEREAVRLAAFLESRLTSGELPEWTPTARRYREELRRLGRARHSGNATHV